MWFLSVRSLRNRPLQPEPKTWPSSTGYTPPYDQYSQYHQQQAYPNYYSSWGYDQTAATYGYTYPQYDYSQYAQSQVSSRFRFWIHILSIEMMTSWLVFLGSRCSGWWTRRFVFGVWCLHVMNLFGRLSSGERMFPSATVSVRQIRRQSWMWWKQTRGSFRTAKNCTMLSLTLSGNRQSSHRSRTKSC